MMTSEGDKVTITITREEYELVKMALGMAMGLSMRDYGPLSFLTLLRLQNSIHEGNPNYTPYAVPPHVTSAPPANPGPPTTAA